MLTLTREILMSLTADDPSIWEFDRTARDILGVKPLSPLRTTSPDPLVEMYVTRSIRELMEQGWALPGNDRLVADSGTGSSSMVELFPWSLDIDDSVARIEREWRSLDHPLFSDDICRFAGTPSGIVEGRRLLEERAGRASP
ncbi:hypothetical protein [Microbacterium sp. P04]|uniref:hypothetical protein n=1 Tax=Microbacterium sp. P04 TaxID=3366947 RepID=UPI003746C232